MHELLTPEAQILVPFILQLAVLKIQDCWEKSEIE